MRVNGRGVDIRMFSRGRVLVVMGIRMWVERRAVMGVWLGVEV